ncbi:MAG TPA: hypothetical protein VMU59_14060 [Caulobacteraceae bacterium]|nr:hypothetical protein [Caulobacteraceae bacterium]
MAAKRKGRGLSGEDLARLTAERAKVRAEERAVEAGLNETVALARLRGEAVDRGGGGLRVTSRDGLQTLFEQGGLPRTEYDAGLLYRRCFEALAAGPRSNLNRDFAAPVRGFSEAGAAAFAELRAGRAENLQAWEALARTGRQLWVLRLVAGEGRTINSIAPGGSARLANTKALTAVLEAIARDRGLRG